VVIFEALTGKQPFAADNVKDLVEKQQQQLSQLTPAGIPVFLSNNKLSQPAQLFLGAIFQVWMGRGW
jgi:hypothetical protein